MKVYELRLKVYLKKELDFSNLPTHISNFITMYLAKKPEFLEYHEAKGYKGYSFDLLYPLERDYKYKADTVYTFRIRVVEERLLQYFLDGLEDFSTEEMKGIVMEPYYIPPHPIETLYSITPVLIKNDGGYWKGKLSLKEFERRIIGNIEKKYEYFVGPIETTQPFYTTIEFKNETPYKIPYKDIVLLGDKLELGVRQDEKSQKLAYLALGTTFSEGNSFGCGFLGYQYLGGRK